VTVRSIALFVAGSLVRAVVADGFRLTGGTSPVR
jgi:hypothetical protein